LFLNKSRRIIYLHPRVFRKIKTLALSISRKYPSVNKYFLEMTELRKAIVIFRRGAGEKHGHAALEEISPKGPVKIRVRAEGFKTRGKHGFHIHRSGNNVAQTRYAPTTTPPIKSRRPERG